LTVANQTCTLHVMKPLGSYARGLVCCLFLLMAMLLAQAQGPMKTTWAKFATFDSMVTSRDGSLVLGFQGGYVRAFHPDGTLLLTQGYNFLASNTVPANDGSGFYVINGLELRFFNVTTRTSTVIRTELNTVSNLNYLAISPDGTQLAYKVLNASGRDQLSVVSNTGTLQLRTTLSAGESVLQIAFPANNRINICSNKAL